MAGRVSRRYLDEDGPLGEVVEGGGYQEEAADVEAEAAECENGGDDGIEADRDLHGVCVAEGPLGVGQSE